MADDFVRQGETFRATEVSSKKLPIFLAGAHARTYYTPQSISASASSQSLTVPAGATHADIYAEGAASTDFVRCWHASQAPTSTVGVRLKDHEVMQSASPSTFRFILGSGSGATTLRVEYYSYA